VVDVPRVTHFEIDAEKPEELTKFYEKVFGWKIVKWEGPIDYWLITTGEEDEPGIDGGLSRRTEGEPNTVNTIEITNIDEYIKKVEETGGTITSPKHPVPGVGWMAYFKDPEGNIFGMMEMDETAK